MAVDLRNPSPLRVYTVVLRCAESLVRMPAGRGIRIAPITSDHGNYELTLLTRTEEVKGIAAPLPRELWIQVTGPAPSMEIALGIAVTITNEYVRQVAFGANAWQGLLSIHLAFESTPGQAERTFFQNWIRDEVGLPRVARVINPDLLFRLLVAIAQLPAKERARIIRATTQYTDALQHWKIGNELYALAHLYMGVEAITPTAIRWEITRRGLKDRGALESAVLRAPKRALPLRIATWLYLCAGGYIPPASLDSWARRELIFCGDNEVFKRAKAASDNLEHGLLHHDEIRRQAVACVEPCAAYLRNAILKFIPLSDDDRVALAGKPYAKPASTGGFERQLLASIICDGDDIAAPDQAYPYVRWAFDLKDFTVADDGGHKMHVTQTITPIMAANARMRLSKIHFAGPTETTHAEVEVTLNEKKPDEPIAGVGILIDDAKTSKWVQPVGSFILNCNATRLIASFWAQRLGLVADHQGAAPPFKDTVDQIKDRVLQDGVPEQLQKECNTAWDEAVQLDEVRLVLSGCVLKPEGLVYIDESRDGKAPLIEDLDKLSEMNAEAIQLTKKLRALLDALMRLPVFSRGTDGK